MIGSDTFMRCNGWKAGFALVVALCLLTPTRLLATDQDEPWPQVFDPMRVLTLHFELDPIIWEDIKKDTNYYDPELNIRVPALMWAEGETNKLTVQIRRKSDPALPSESDPQKVSLKIDINEYVSGQKWRNLTKLSLENGAGGNGVLREGLAMNLHRLAAEAGFYDYPAGHASWVRVVVNSNYVGLYSSPEQRDKQFLRSRGSLKTDAVWLYEVNAGTFLDTTVATNHSPTYNYLCFSPFRTACSQPTNPSVAIAMESSLNGWVDMNGMLTLAAIESYISNTDGLFTKPGKNSFFVDFLPSQQRKRQYYPWDLDAGFSNTSLDIYNGGPGPANQRVYQRQILDHYWFRHMYRHVFSDLLDGPLNPAFLSAFLDQLEPVLTPYLVEDPNANIGGDAAGHFNSVRQYFSNRAANVRGQIGVLTAPPRFSRGGGEFVPGFQLALTHTNPSGTIYYTLDGTDPRALGGAPAGTAYTTPLVPTNTTHVMARVLISTNWSALRQATYNVAAHAGGLRVTEIMYAPADAADPFSAGDFEFIEMKNMGTAPVDLSGGFFTGIDFTFSPGTIIPPGAFIVLVKNPAAFSNRYPGVSFQGVYDGGIARDGEQIRLRNSDGNNIFSVRYSSDSPWPQGANGLGYSLVILDPDGDPNDPANWRASTEIHGSPGADDPEPPYATGLVINEVLANSSGTIEDAIEIFNPTESPIDISGWYLSDRMDLDDPDRALLKKYRIPDATIVPAGGFVVFYENAFNPLEPDANALIPFGLSRNGEEAWLSSADAEGELNGFITGFRFGASESGVSIGRHITSVGTDYTFMEQHSFGVSHPTSLEEFRSGVGVPNAAPKVGPVVINEILYNPQAGGAPYLELHNISGSTVDLGDWQMRGAAFVFPANTPIVPGGFLVLVDTSEMTTEAFRTLHDVPVDVPILGNPFGLRNGGEDLELRKPNSNPGDPRIVVDRVFYGNNAPWPTEAAGLGPSLERIAPTAYGNDPVNWRTSAPGGTPGRPNRTEEGVAVTTRSAWRVQHTGFELGAPWRARGYSDSGWTQGQGPFGYGHPQVQTVLANQEELITTYFRKQFVLNAPANALASLTLFADFDDGFIAYLNGEEVARRSMPAGPVTAETLAFSRAAGHIEAIDLMNHRHLLVAGANVLAVEVHQSSASDEVMFWDAELTYTLASSFGSLEELIEGGNTALYDLDPVFDNPGGDPLTYGASADNTNVVSVSVSDSILSVTPLLRGQAIVTVTADDGVNPPASTTFRVLVYPEAYVLENDEFTFGAWSPAEPAGRFPAHMIFLQSDQIDTERMTPLEFAYSIAGDTSGTTNDELLPYAATTRTRINGLNDDGIAFINTGRSRDLGGALLALDTRNVTHAPVSWLGGTVTPNTRVYAIRLQYRIGTGGDFTDVLDGNGQPIEYVRNAASGHTQPKGPVLLPPEALGQDYVQLLWRYYRVSGESGARAQLRLDEVLVANTIGAPASQLEFGIHPPAFWQSGRPLPPLTVRAVNPDGFTDPAYTETVTLSVLGEGILSGVTAVEAVGGLATFTNLTVTGLGTNRLQATSGSLDSAWSSLLSLSDITGVLVPQFIQGEQDALGDNNDRIPFAFRAQIDGLLPNATYRYGNRVVGPSDGETTDGAGNMIFVTGSETDWIRSTSAPRFRDTDLGVRHHEFGTDANGSYTGWFITEPSGNARFTPGSTMQMRILLNNGQGGTNEQHYLTLSEEVTVIRFGSLANEATGIMGESVHDPKHFVYLYDTTAGAGRPLAGVPIEITGSGADNRYAQFYEQVVAVTPRFWGTLIPNTLPSGVRRIETRSLADGSILSADTNASGVDGTVNPSGGLDPVLVGADAGIPVFLPGGNGTWDMNASWSTGMYPNGVDAVAIVNAPFDADRDIDIFTPVTNGHLIVNHADSTNMTRIRARNIGNTLTFESSSGPAELTINGSGSGFVEFRAEESIVLASDLLITIMNLNETHGMEGVSENDFGALRLRDVWTGPGGLIKAGAGVMTLTGTGKEYVGETVVDYGVLRVTEPATPVNTAGVTVNPGGQLRLVSTGDRLYPFGGAITLNGMGRGGDVPSGEELGVRGALRYDPGSNDNRVAITNSVVIAGPTSLHVDGSRNVMELSGTLSGAGAFSKSGGGILVLSGDSSGYTVPVTVSNGALQVDGVLGSAVSVAADGTLSGAGHVGALSGSGIVSPGPGTATLTAPSVNGLHYQFTFTETDAGILRLTGGTPFINALNAANTIALFFDVETLNENTLFEGGIFTDEASDFFASIENATWLFYVRDAEGTVERDGQTYSVYGGSPLEIGTAGTSVDFGDGPVSGRILRIGTEPDLAGFALWQNDNFSAAELNDPDISGPLADPDQSGIQNLLRYALGLGRYDEYVPALPRIDNRGGDNVLIHRRLLDPESGVAYIIQVRKDLLAGMWLTAAIGTDLIFEGSHAVGDGRTEEVEYKVLEDEIDNSKYFRLKVNLLEP